MSKNLQSSYIRSSRGSDSKQVLRLNKYTRLLMTKHLFLFSFTYTMGLLHGSTYLRRQRKATPVLTGH